MTKNPTIGFKIEVLRSREIRRTIHRVKHGKFKRYEPVKDVKRSTLSKDCSFEDLPIWNFSAYRLF